MPHTVDAGHRRYRTPLMSDTVDRVPAYDSPDPRAHGIQHARARHTVRQCGTRHGSAVVGVLVGVPRTEYVVVSSLRYIARVHSLRYIARVP